MKITPLHTYPPPIPTRRNTDFFSQMRVNLQKTLSYTQMAVGETVFRPKDRRDLKHTSKIGHERHLLVQLGALGQIRVRDAMVREVVHFEHLSAGLRPAAEHLWRMDLREPLVLEKLAPETADARLDPQNSLVGQRAQVEDSVVQPGGQMDLNRGTVGHGRGRVGQLEFQLAWWDSFGRAWSSGRSGRR